MGISVQFYFGLGAKKNSWAEDFMLQGVPAPCIRRTWAFVKKLDDQKTEVFKACPHLTRVRRERYANWGLSVPRRAYALKESLLDIIGTRWLEDYSLQGVPMSSNLGDNESQT